MKIIIDKLQISDDDLITDIDNLPKSCILIDKENREWKYSIGYDDVVNYLRRIKVLPEMDFMFTVDY
jgi:hypothetical protein